VVRAKKVTLMPPKYLGAGVTPITIWAVHAAEKHPPTGADALEWLILTSEPCEGFEAAERVLRYYALRWRIEDFHKAWKSGCGVENRQAKRKESLEAALAVDVVVAWRIMWLTKLGRETPDVPCSIFFDQEEWQALHCFVNKTKTPPAVPPRLRDAVRMVATLGGFLGRKSDREPGTETIWRGIERLMDFTIAFRMFFPSD
jgi:hypothetical protein